MSRSSFCFVFNGLRNFVVDLGWKAHAVREVDRTRVWKNFIHKTKTGSKAGPVHFSNPDKMVTEKYL